MKIKLLAIVAAASLFAVGCSDKRLIDNVSGMTPKEGGFKTNLHRDYVDLARVELNEGDIYDASVFARRAEEAAMGQDIDPDILWDRHYTSSNFDTLSNERSRLMSALDGGGRDKFGDTAATAQSQFDCWAQELEENNQPDDIKNCRDGYETAIAALEEALKPKPIAKKPEPRKPAPAPAPPVVRNFLLFFDFDSVELTAESQAIIEASVKTSRQVPVSVIEAIGHADSAGSDAYNFALSERRAEAVKAALVRLGVASDGVAVSWKGEKDPLIQTTDGIREPQNRRVEIVLK